MKQILIIALICFVLTFFIGFLLKKAKKAQQKVFYMVGQCFFYVRWWLIGKTHCTINPKWKRFWWICHKTLWFIIFMSVSYTFAMIVGLE